MRGGRDNAAEGGEGSGGRRGVAVTVVAVSGGVGKHWLPTVDASCWCGAARDGAVRFAGGRRHGCGGRNAPAAGVARAPTATATVTATATAAAAVTTTTATAAAVATTTTAIAVADAR